MNWNIGMPQNIGNYGLALLMLSSKKQREGKGCVEDATKKTPNNKIQERKQKDSYNCFFKFS